MGVIPILSYKANRIIMTKTEIDISPQVNSTVELIEPSRYKVIYVNDDKTTIEFVTASLMSYFDYSPQMANDLCLDIHQHGSAIVAVLPYEMAEQKGIEVTLSARAQGFPLLVKIEPELD